MRSRPPPSRPGSARRGGCGARSRGCCGSWSLARVAAASCSAMAHRRRGSRPQAPGRTHGDCGVGLFDQTPSRGAPRRCRAIGRGRRWAPEWAGRAPSGRRSLHRPQQARCCSLSAPAESLPTCPRAPLRAAIGKSEYPAHWQQLSRSPGLAARCTLYAPREPVSGRLRIDPETVLVSSYPDYDSDAGPDWPDRDRHVLTIRSDIRSFGCHDSDRHGIRWCPIMLN